MKKFILFIILYISSFSLFSQAVIENGYVAEKGEFVFDYKTVFPEETFHWFYSNEKTSLLCIMREGDSIITSIEWDIVELHKNGLTIGFTVTNDKKEKYFLDFSKKGGSVIIYNCQNSTYSIMEGEGVNYKEI